MTRAWVPLGMPLVLLAAALIPPAVAQPPTPPVVINEVELSGPPGPMEAWVELFNPNGSTAVTVDGWTVDFPGADGGVHPAPGALIPARGFLVLPLPAPPLAGRSNGLRLLDPLGRTVDAVPALGDDHADGRTWARHPDGATPGDLRPWAFGPGTPGAPDGARPPVPPVGSGPGPSPAPGLPDLHLLEPRADPTQALVGSQVLLSVRVKPLTPGANVTATVAGVASGVILSDPDGDGIYSGTWDTSGAAVGDHAIGFQARAPGGATTDPLKGTVEVHLALAQVDQEPPSVQDVQVNPQEGTEGVLFILYATVMDGSGVREVDLTVRDGEGMVVDRHPMVPTDVAPVYTATWDANGSSPGIYDLGVEAVDALGNAVALERGVQVRVDAPAPVPSQGPEVAITEASPQEPSAGESVVVSAQGPPAAVQGRLEFIVNGSRWQSVPMVREGDHWRGKIPAQGPGAQVDYVVVLQDGQGLQARSSLRGVAFPSSIKIAGASPNFLAPALYLALNTFLALGLFFRGRGWRRPLAAWMLLVLLTGVLGLALWRAAHPRASHEDYIDRGVRQPPGTMVDVGERAPDFTLPDEGGQLVTLSKELGRGPLVLSFYVFDFTGVCEGQLCALRDRFGDLQREGATVFGVSTDSPASHRAFKEKEGLQYRLLSDWNKEVSRKYGVQYDDFGTLHLRGVSKRSVFVLDRTGVVKYRWVTEDPKVPPDIQKVVQAVKAAK